MAVMQVHLTRVDLVAVGSLASDYGAIASDYERRLSRYVKLHVHELKAEPVQRGEPVVLRAEGERMLAVLDKLGAGSSGGPGLRIVALDLRGGQPTTEQLAVDWLGASQLVLLLGGTLGLAPAVLARADAAVSFGRITLPHQLARVVATEQLYRAFRIARGEPYHF